MTELPNKFSGEVEFNEGLGIVYRLNTLQEKINKSMENLFSYNKELTSYGYLDCYSNLTNMFLEISHDCTDKEKAEVLELQKLLDQAIKLPFFNKRNSASLAGNKHTSSPHLDNMEFLTKLLEAYRMKINHLAKVHGYKNPEKKDSRRAMGS